MTCVPEGSKRSAHRRGFTKHLSGSVSEVSRVGRVEIGGGVMQLSPAGHITSDFISCPHWKSCRSAGVFTENRDSCIFQVGDILRVRVIWGLMKTVSGVLHVLAMRELPEAQVEAIYSSSLRVFGFYQPVSGWPLPATVTGLLSSLIHLWSSPQSSGCPPGWPRTDFPLLAVAPQPFEALGRAEPGPDAERAGYESACLQGRNGWGDGWAEDPNPEAQPMLRRAHGASAAASFAATHWAAGLPETEAHLPHPAGSRESHRPDPRIH